MIKKLLFILAVCWTCCLVHAQELTVKSMVAAPMDLSASLYERKDLADKPCALVKVILPLEGVKFEGNVLGKVENKDGEYWVYMSEGSKQLRVKHALFMQTNVRFADYGINALEGKVTYMLTIASRQATLQGQGVDIDTFTIKGVSFNMVHVEGGSFPMGSNDSEADSDEKPVHQVTLSSYMIGETEVTQALWQAVMGSNPSIFKGANLPVENVSWNDCQTFISKLNGLTGKKFHLPSEAEWEYAARGGMKSRGCKYSGNNDIDNVAWYNDNSESKTHAVGMKRANELGLYDMSGNVFEWCQDRYGEYAGSPQTNPTGSDSQPFHVYRGGGWNNDMKFCRSTARSHFYPKLKRNNLGLRLAL